MDARHANASNAFNTEPSDTQNYPRIGSHTNIENARPIASCAIVPVLTATTRCQTLTWQMPLENIPADLHL